MALQDQPFKNYKKINARKMLISSFEYNQPKTKISTCIKKSFIFWVFIIPFNFGHDYIINATLRKCAY